jgi:hypothetical protein
MLQWTGVKKHGMFAQVGDYNGIAVSTRFRTMRTAVSLIHDTKWRESGVKKVGYTHAQWSGGEYLGFDETINQSGKAVQRIGNNEVRIVGYTGYWKEMKDEKSGY